MERATLDGSACYKHVVERLILEAGVDNAYPLSLHLAMFRVSLDMYTRSRPVYLTSEIDERFHRTVQPRLLTETP